MSRRIGSLLPFALLLPASLGAERRTASPAPAPFVVDSCAPPALPDASTVRLDTGAVYRIRGPDTLRIDIARPASPAGAPPLVLLVHGGGWRGGDRSSRLRDQLLRLAGQGYAAASLDYRLTHGGRNVYPAAMQDVVCAVRWLRSRRRELGIDASRLVVMGESSGGQLAALVGTAPDLPRFAGDCEVPGSAHVQGVIAMYGLLDIAAVGAAPRLREVVEGYLGGDLDSLAARARESSPVAQANARAAPFLLIHGGADQSVPPAHSRAMQAALRRAGVDATYVEVPDAGHGFPMLSDAPGLRVATCAALAFLDARLRH